MRKMLVLIALALAACDPGVTIAQDAAPPAPDFFGEACTADPYPAVTVCREGAGWCVDGTCRPMCGQTERCAAGVVRFTAGGGCYCAPE